MIERTPTQHTETPIKVVFLNGLSEPTSCALTREQYEFMHSLDVPNAYKILLNFPYLEDRAHNGPAPPLWLASLRNARQFLRDSHKSFVEPARRHVAALAQSADHLFVITISCGLEIWIRCARDLPKQTAIHILALGPVAWSVPSHPHTMVQGSRDYVSKLFFRSIDVRLRGVGHMSYLESPQVRELANQHLCRSILKS